MQYSNCMSKCQQLSQHIAINGNKKSAYRNCCDSLKNRLDATYCDKISNSYSYVIGEGGGRLDITREMELFKDTTVYDWHEHVWARGPADELDVEQCERLAEHLRLLYIDKVAVSCPSDGHETPDKLSSVNNAVYEAVKRYPGFFYGMCFTDPHHGSAAVAEIERCVGELGFVGVKLYTQRTIDHPMQYPLIEKCIELDIPILMHSMRFGLRYPGPEHFASHSAHYANIAKRYPEAVFIVAHIVNGDWHWQLKGLADCPNVFCDISGSTYDQGVVDDVVSVFGAERVLFGADGSFSASVGKILGSDISDRDKRTILNAPRFTKYMDRGSN